MMIYVLFEPSCIFNGQKNLHTTASDTEQLAKEGTKETQIIKGHCMILTIASTAYHNHRSTSSKRVSLHQLCYFQIYSSIPDQEESKYILTLQNVTETNTDLFIHHD